MLRDILKLVLAAFITGTFGALATTLYTLVFSQVSTDYSATQQAQMVSLLGEISQKLDGQGVTGSSGIITRFLSPDTGLSQPVDIAKLAIDHEQLQNYRRLFFGLFGPWLYSTSISIKGLEEANLLPGDIARVRWKFNNNTSTTTGNQPLYLSKITSSFNITAEVWLGDAVAEAENIDNPVILDTRVAL